jgi:phospholipid/cholesterol/gamma-HCH transport system substrate-binding protein
MPQRKKGSLAELRIGLLVLAAITILILGIFAVSGDIGIFGSKTIVRSQLSNIDGLRKGAEVRLSGKKIGSVKDIIFSHDIPPTANAQNLIEVVMQIDGRIDGRPAVERIRTDSRAILKSAGVLGDYVIDITPGTLNAKPIKDGDRIPSLAQKSVGDIINASQTAVANFNDISDDIKNVTEDIRAGRGSLGRFIKDEGFYVDLDKTVLRAQLLVDEIRNGKGTAGRLINDPQLYNEASETIASLKRLSTQVSDQLNAGRGTIGKLFKDEEVYNRTNAMIAKLNETSNRLERMTAKIERGEGNLGKLLNDEKFFNDTHAAVENVRTITGRLERGEGSAGLLLKDERLYNNVNNLSTELTKLLYDFRQNPRKYLSVKLSVF